MGLSDLSARDREFQKFDTNDSGEVIVRTSATGSFSVSGLNIGGLITEVTLNASTWVALPTSALADRNAIAIENRSGIEIKINYNSGQAGYVGMTIPDGGERQYDISDSIIIYAKSASGTPLVTIEEIA